MKRLRWTPAAAGDLGQIREYLDANHPHFTQRTVRDIYGTIRQLKSMPHLGREGRISGTRELIFAGLPYIAVYRVRGDAVEILHIHHTSQAWPPK